MIGDVIVEQGQRGKIQLLECSKVEDRSTFPFGKLPSEHSMYAITGEWSVHPDYLVKIVMVINDKFDLNSQEIEIRALDILADWINQFQAGDIEFEQLFTKKVM